MIWEEDGKHFVAIRGPETQATSAPVPEDSASFGVIFRLGVYMPDLPVIQLVDDQIQLPDATRQKIWLNGSAWELPTYQNVDVFIDRLVRENILVREPLIESALFNHTMGDVSLRTIQRRFLHTTGISHNTILQIERARHATMLLKNGSSILNTVDALGYSDQPHLTRSLKRYIGQTPAQISDPDRIQPVSFLFKTPNLL